MESPSSRALHLLSLLQTGRVWTASELARRLDVADRTVRRDIARLRSLGYDVRAKLEQLLPPTLQRRARATASATQIITPAAGPADWQLLGMLAETVAQDQHLHFTYTDQHGQVTERQVRPHRHVLRNGTWYLIAYDTQRDDWRLFRVDRIQNATPQRARHGLDVPDFPHQSIEDWLTTDFGRQQGRPD